MPSVKPLKFPRCLNCSTMMWIFDWRGRRKKYVKCSTCDIMYSKASILDADPQRWNQVRVERLFKLKVDQRGRKFILLNDGLGGRR